ncbi:Major allergen Asp f 2 [Penicillium daleae]|uniref:Major allergen Asp f 2 n=1 Tax=Penicillium daleae TaxID=63821 RepID=A0AAD6FYK6_9EURO|nr:Major allergen Asp f 2 [Penicillium daleae]KAJ5437891.1 Major allergen Asp f 2 [Penicillium daleae]
MEFFLGFLIFCAATTSALPALGSGNLSKPFMNTGHTPWNAGGVTQFPIHSSCNATQRRQIELGLAEAVDLAAHARDHILRWRNESEIYRKYFGNGPSMEAIGAFEVVVNGDKNDVLFRCDNPDGNCDLEGYAGHWRGENGTKETVICDLSYETRRSLSTMCGMGYTISGSETNTFWASDLLHRLYHLPAIGQNWVDHYADGYHEVIELATENVTLSTHDSETLQYFALEVYAHDISIPGIGCPGEQHGDKHEDETGDANFGESQPSATTATSKASSTTVDVPANCHTHEGGELHCT